MPFLVQPEDEFITFQEAPGALTSSGLPDLYHTSHFRTAVLQTHPSVTDQSGCPPGIDSEHVCATQQSHPCSALPEL